MKRGEIYWCDFGDPVGSAPAKRRPAVVIQDDGLNRSRLPTVIVAVLTSNTARSAMPGSVFVPSSSSGLGKDSVVNMTGLMTVDRSQMDQHAVAQVPDFLMAEVDQGLRRVLDL